MKKLNIILHETTIINFPFFWKLLIRYKWLSLVLPLLIFSYASYYYKSQNDIYLRKKFFKNVATEAEGPSSAIASVLGEQTNTLTASEVVGIIGSLDFQQEFSKEVIKDKEFHELNITPLNSKEKVNLSTIVEACNGLESCIENRVRGIIFGFIRILPDRLVVNKYFVQVNTLDPDTTRFLLNKISDKIVRSRVSAIRRNLDEQIRMSRELADTKRAELEKVDLKHLKDQVKTYKVSLDSINRKIERNNSFRQTLKLELALAETQVNETKKVYKDNIEADKLLTFQKRQRLELKVKKLEEDIAAIRSVSYSISSQDNVILTQLRDELKKAKRELSAMGTAGRKVSSDAKFILSKENESNYTEFDFKVKKEQYKKASVTYEELVKERDKTTVELSKLEGQLEDLQPSFEYLKLLEQKIIQLTLLNSTVVSDLVFENQLSSQSIFKKVNKSKIFLFAFSVSLTLLVVLISVLFLMDDRIYDQQELEKSFEDLTIIGNTPDFD
jgi:hypothetical protein